MRRRPPAPGRNRSYRPPPLSREPLRPAAERGGRGGVSRQQRKMAADSEVSVPPFSSPALSAEAVSPLTASPALSPRSPSRRCLRSRTSPPPPSGRGRYCRRSRSPHRGPWPGALPCLPRPAPAEGSRGAGLAGSRWQPGASYRPFRRVSAAGAQAAADELVKRIQSSSF